MVDGVGQLTGETLLDTIRVIQAPHAEFSGQIGVQEMPIRVVPMFGCDGKKTTTLFASLSIETPWTLSANKKPNSRSRLDTPP